MTAPQPVQPVVQLRVAMTLSDFEQLTNFDCDRLDPKEI